MSHNISFASVSLYSRLKIYDSVLLPADDSGGLSPNRSEFHVPTVHPVSCKTDEEWNTIFNARKEKRNGKNCG